MRPKSSRPTTVDPSAAVPAAAGGSILLTPAGHLVFARAPSPPASPGDDRGARVARGGDTSLRRIEAAFAQGWGRGLLHLGLEERVGEPDSALEYWRSLSRLFWTKVRALLDLAEAVRAGLDVPLEEEELERLLSSAPPMVGLEYLSRETLLELWRELARAFASEVAQEGGDAERYLAGRQALWRSLGRVFFHLAENRARPDRPFAFLATYTARVSGEGRLQHVPLGRALREQAAAADREGLLALLAPVQAAAARSPFLKELVDSSRLFQPQAWSPDEAHRFLRDLPLFEESGIFVRVPNWWRSRTPPRLQVGVTLGSVPAMGLGLGSILDFSVAISLDGEPISRQEWKEILATSGSLALVRGRWVEVDRERLQEALRHWGAAEEAARRGELTFHQGMRLLAGLPTGPLLARPEGSRETDAEARSRRWVSIEAGEWLRGALEELRSPAALAARFSSEELRATLRPYQEEGVRWLQLLYRLRLGGCLADDMGLGKTLQVIALLLLVRRERSAAGGEAPPSLLVLPASLIGNWKAECERFAPSLRLAVAHPSEEGAPLASPPSNLARLDLVITTYGMLSRLAWAREVEWNIVILDEAQAIKTPGARQSRTVKSLRSRWRLALTGTPIENRLGDLWSLFEFLSPELLGSAKEFARLLDTPPPGDAPGSIYGRVRSLVRPYILRRMKSDRRIISDLPDKQELRVYCGLRRTQAVLYQEAVNDLERSLKVADGIRRRGLVLASLTRLKQICNHPSQWTGDGAYDPAESGKTARLLELAEELAARQEKALVFTQFKEIAPVLARLLAGVFGRPGHVLDGSTPVKRRREMVDAFQREDGAPFFVLSLKAGGTGLNLTAATHVIHFDRWWNPAVESQATDRAYRIGQKRSVLVHKFVCRGTLEEGLENLLLSKRILAEEVLREGPEAALTEMSTEDLMRLVSLDPRRAAEEA